MYWLLLLYLASATIITCIVALNVLMELMPTVPRTADRCFQYVLALFLSISFGIIAGITFPIWLPIELLVSLQ